MPEAIVCEAEPTGYARAPISKKRVQAVTSRLFSDMFEHLPGFGCIGTGCSYCANRLADFARTDSFEGTRDLRYIFYAPNSEPHFTSGCHGLCLPSRAEAFQRLHQAFFGLVGNSFLFDDIPADLWMGCFHEPDQVRLPSSSR